MSLVTCCSSFFVLCPKGCWFESRLPQVHAVAVSLGKALHPLCLCLSVVHKWVSGGRSLSTPGQLWLQLSHIPFLSRPLGSCECLFTTFPIVLFAEAHVFTSCRGALWVQHGVSYAKRTNRPMHRPISAGHRGARGPEPLSLMQRARSLRGLAALSLAAPRPGALSARRKKGPPAAAATQWPSGGPGWGVGHTHSGSRMLCSGPGRDLSAVSAVGSPDPLTWLRCRLIILLVNLYFEVDLASEEFHSGAKQALVQVSHLMSTGHFHRLKGLVSDEVMEYVENRTKALSRTQMEKLLVTTDDIIFLLPEDVSVVFDGHGRKFCSIVMRFWFLTTLEGPEDPEATRIFRVAPRQDGGPQEKVATAVYELLQH
uniref:Uncharacterized protein n=1 Tax=Neogobius melanostomus TaxID=47308 RepID=A0A8C6SR11_9GOBI